MQRSIALVLLLTLLTLTGCNAVRGFGQDMQKAGQWMENEADKHK